MTLKLFPVLLASVSLLLTGCNSPEYNPQTIDPEVIDGGGGEEPVDPEFEPWVPEIIDLDDPVEIIDVPVDETVYDYSNVSFKTVSGDFTSEDGTYTANETKSMAVSDENTSPFTHGTYSADIMIPSAGDTGIIFGLSSIYDEDYWEGYGISYYFFFINFEGTIYLGKSADGDWIEMKIGSAIDIDEHEGPVNLKVLFYGNKLICFVDNEIQLAIRDDDYLTGTDFGFRTGAKDVVVSNVFVSSDRVI